MSQSIDKDGTGMENYAAPFFPRLAAYLLDILIISAVLLIVRIPLFFIEMATPDLFIFHNLLFEFDVFDIIFYVLSVAYFIVFTTLTGTTPGKRAFNLAVVDENGEKLKFWKATYRETIGRYLSFFFCFGYIMIMIDKRKRAFHDYLCDTSVIYTVKLKVKVKQVPMKAYEYPRQTPPMNRPMPMQGIQQGQPMQPIQGMSPMQSTQSVQPMQPVQGMSPMQSVQPAQPMQPVQGMSPMQSAQSVQEVKIEQTEMPVQEVKIEQGIIEKEV